MHSGPTDKTDIRRGKWQRAGLLALAFTIMFLSLKSCPGDIHVRSTNAIVAGYAVESAHLVNPAN